MQSKPEELKCMPAQHANKLSVWNLERETWITLIHVEMFLHAVIHIEWLIKSSCSHTIAMATTWIETKYKMLIHKEMLSTRYVSSTTIKPTTLCSSMMQPIELCGNACCTPASRWISIRANYVPARCEQMIQVKTFFALIAHIQFQWQRVTSNQKPAIWSAWKCFRHTWWCSNKARPIDPRGNVFCTPVLHRFANRR